MPFELKPKCQLIHFSEVFDGTINAAFCLYKLPFFNLLFSKITQSDFEDPLLYS